jgi:hypothetical protein
MNIRKLNIQVATQWYILQENAKESIPQFSLTLAQGEDSNLILTFECCKRKLETKAVW